MEFRTLGHSGLKVSTFGLGGNTFGPPRVEETMSIKCIHAALDYGVNFIDTADMYGKGESERWIGKALAGGKRNRTIIATKFNLRNLNGESGRARILRKCEESLAKLQTDHIDLFQMHMASEEVHPEEILRAFDDLVKAGKVRFIGEVNYGSWRHVQYVTLARLLGLPEFTSVQNHFNLFVRQVEQEVLPMCKAYNAGFIVNQALAGGFLTDKYVKGQPPPPGTRGAAGSPMVKHTRTEQNDEKQDILKNWAHERGHTMLELAFAWLLSSHPEVSVVLAGVSTPEQVAANAKAITWHLTPQEVEDIDNIVFAGEFRDWVDSLSRGPGGGGGD